MRIREDSRAMLLDDNTITCWYRFYKKKREIIENDWEVQWNRNIYNEKKSKMFNKKKSRIINSSKDKKKYNKIYIVIER